MPTIRKALLSLVWMIIIQGCAPPQSGAPDSGLSTDLTVIETPTSTFLPQPTGTPLPSPTIASTPTLEIPSPLPPAVIFAEDGNLFIRRGPGLEYNAVGVLERGESAALLGLDQLSNWGQILIPGGEASGWISLQTPFTKITGELSSLPSFLFTEWPVPAYIKNCTEHDMFIAPINEYLYSLYTNAEYKNEIQVNPGLYVAYDMFYPDEPEAQRFEVQEGMTAYITWNGRGEGHKCP